jgi:prepilin-type N-terminal cleavage/methylation domain-containing protein
MKENNCILQKNLQNAKNRAVKNLENKGFWFGTIFANKKVQNLKQEVQNMRRKGFTLIELLIVIAIIAILAAIAIPQFAKYRIRAYNGAAESDLRNARTTFESLFADWQRYPNEVNKLTGTITLTVPLPSREPFSDTFNTSTNVYFASATNTGGLAPNSSYTMVTHHLQGDTEYGADSDVQGIYYQKNGGFIGNDLPVAPPASNPQQDDFAGGSWILQ